MARPRKFHENGDQLTMEVVAEILGVQSRTLRRPNVRKQLPVEKDPLTGVPFVRRLPLLKFLADNKYPDQVMRRLLTRRASPTLCYGLPSEVRLRLKGCRLTWVGGPICLGRRLATVPPKAVVFGVEWLPPGRGEQYAEELRRLDDRPVIMAMCRWDPPGDLFDTILRPDILPGDLKKVLEAVPDPNPRR